MGAQILVSKKPHNSSIYNFHFLYLEEHVIDNGPVPKSTATIMGPNPHNIYR